MHFFFVILIKDGGWGCTVVHTVAGVVFTSKFVGRVCHRLGVLCFSLLSLFFCFAKKSGKTKYLSSSSIVCMFVLYIPKIWSSCGGVIVYAQP